MKEKPSISVSCLSRDGEPLKDIDIYNLPTNVVLVGVHQSVPVIKPDGSITMLRYSSELLYGPEIPVDSVETLSDERKKQFRDSEVYSFVSHTTSEGQTMYHSTGKNTTVFPTFEAMANAVRDMKEKFDSLGSYYDTLESAVKK